MAHFAIGIMASSTAVAPPLVLSGTPVTATNVGSSYTFTVTASGGEAPYTYAKDGTWPTGITVNSSTGVVSGPATSSGTFPNLRVKVTDNLGNTAYIASFTLTVYNLTITGTPPSSVFVGSVYNFTPSVSGGFGTYTFSKVGTWPSWLSLNTSNGNATGSPSSAGTWSGLSIKVTDGLGTQKQLANFSITAEEEIPP